jgi:hypothetical protein
MCKKLNYSDMLITILRNFHEKEQRKEEQLASSKIKTYDSIYGKKDKFLSKKVEKKKVLQKNILNFSYKDISIAKSGQNHIDSLDLLKFNKKFLAKKKSDRYVYMKSLKTLNRKKVLLEEKENFNSRQTQLLQDNYAKLINSFPLKKTKSAYMKYQRDLKKHPYKKYLKIKTIRDLVRVKLLELERKNKKKDHFAITKKMKTAFGLTQGINFLPKPKILLHNKKLNL